MKHIIRVMALAVAASGAAISSLKPHTLTNPTQPGHAPEADRLLFNTSDAFNRIIYPRANTGATGPDPVQQLLHIAPTSNTCAGAPFPDECVASSLSVVQAIVNGFAKYQITTAEEQAALLSWMAYESGDFKYNHNHFPSPGNPGQGTRCMMSPTFVHEYAQSIPELRANIGVGATPADLDATLALVQPDQYSFAAAAWYYNQHCTDAQKRQVQAGGQNNWASAFIAGCVNTAMDDRRSAYWIRACEALGVKVTQ
ncbi:hypothetical protein CLCR_05120 [Cladophialophora carrionii]|uniref:Uncharacterized protein n=1 Tax=Cladophialophora carrionii TaxID=86049 RepID=A0A1C1CKA6_9EURO|nr:hypothetical protein CLCR_05120 [Cladophialophora carrionii]